MNIQSFNENQPPPIQRARPEERWPTILQLVLSLVGAITLWVTAFLFLILAFIPQAGSAGQLASTRDSALLWAGSLAFSGLLLLPSAGFALLRLMERPAPAFLSLTPRVVRWGVFLLAVVVFPLVLVLGYFVSQGPVSWLFLPLLQILAIGIPVLVLVYLGRHGLPKGSPQRDWGVFDAGLVLGPSLILLLEVIAIGVLGMLVLIYIASDPTLSATMVSLAQSLYTMEPDPERIMQLVEPLLFRPGIIFLGFVFLSVIVPLIEETLKPIGVWLLAGRHLKPVDGFSLGLLSGSGYAFFESLLLSSGGGTWAATVLARAGTSVIHIFTAGLMGWALVLAWEERRYLRLGLVYIGMVLIHGTWNGVTLWSTLATVRYSELASAPLWARLGYVMPVVLLAIIVVLFSALLYLNYRWRHAIIHQSIQGEDRGLPANQIDTAVTGMYEPADNPGTRDEESSQDEVR